MRPARPLVLAVVFVLAVLAGTDQVVFAVGQSAGVGSEEAPDQRWGSAAGRGHTASVQTTDASAEGGRDEALTGRGELPAEQADGVTHLPSIGRTPEPGPAVAVEAPASVTPQGFDAKRSKEVAGERAERERTYLNPDGTYTTRFYTEPVNFRTADGSWKSIDTTLLPQGSPGPSTMSADEEGWETGSTEAQIEFGGTADADPVVRMQVDKGVSVGYGVDDAHPVAGQAEDSTLTYENARPNADVEFIAGSDSVKETLVLKDVGAPAEWRFPLELEGLTAQLDAHGNVVFVNAEGAVRAWTPAGWMQDSNLAPDSNEGAISSGVTYSLVVEDGRQVLVVKLDKNWLSAPERVFPVRVDPSVQTVAATSGTYVEYPYTTNFASDTVLKVGTYDAGSHKASAFLRFTGLETALKNAWVISANLALYNTWSQSCTARPVTVHPITSNWGETTTSKWPGPSTGASLVSKSFAHGWRPEGTTSWSCGPAWETIKLGSAGRKLVDDWTHARKGNYGLAVKASATDSKSWKQFGSDDYPGGKPSLDITWTKYGAAYSLGDFTAPVTATTEGVEKITVTNQGQSTWPAGGNYKLRYNLFDAAGKEIADSTKIRWTAMPQAISPGESITLDAKVAPLTPATYTVQWTMEEVGVSRFTAAGVPGAAVKLSAVNIPPQLTAESPGSGITVDTLTPTLWAKGTDADRYPKAALQYSFEVCEVEGSDLRKNCKTGTRSEAQQWAVPSGWLSWDKTYAWYGYVYDGSATSTRPGASLLTTQVPQPAVTSHLGGADEGKEIGTRDGNYVTAATDAALTTVGPELSLTRTYNSLDPRTGGAFGTGWSTRWDMQLREEPATASVLITLSDGSQARFGKNADGTYTGPSGGSLTLTRQSTDWVLRERSGATYRFLAGGVLTKISDVAGRSQTIAHANATGGPVKKVTDDLSGRSLSFGWTGQHVTTVTTSAIDANTPGLTWSYAYTGDQLTKVCPPTSTTKCTAYEYATGSVYRSGVLDSSPSSYWRLGEAEGSVAASEAVSRTGLNDAVHRDTLLGAGSAIAGTADNSAGFDGVDSVVELPADTLKTSAFPTIEVWFKTTTAAGVLVSFQNADVGEKPTSANPILNVDGAGKLRGRFYLSGGVSAVPITSPQAVTDGAWHHAVLTAAANTQSLYLDGVKLGSISGVTAGQSREYVFLGTGYANGGWMDMAAGWYPFTGQMDEVAFYDHTLDPATVAEHYAARTAVGQLTKVTLPSGREHATATYDTVSGRLTEHTDDNGGTWKVSAPVYSNASSSYADTIQRSGPTGYWRLGERGGAEAVSPLGDDLAGIYPDTVEPGAAGIFADGDDTAASFTGDGAVEMPVESLGTQAAMSLELWFRTESQGVLVTNQDADFGETPTGWRPMLLIDSAGKLRGRFSGTGSSLLSMTAVTDNEWHHVLLTGNAGIQALFLDGAFQSSLNSGNPVSGRYPKVFVGGGYASTSWDGQTAGYRNFTGQIDEVAFYDKPLVTFTQTAGVWTYVPPSAGRPDVPTQHIQARRSLIAGRGDQYNGVTLADAPAAYWRLGEAEGTTLGSEVGGPGMNATFRPDTGATSKVDQAGVFGAGDDRAVKVSGGGSVQLPGSILAGTTDVTVELWFRTAAASGVLLGLQNAPLGQTPTSANPILNVDAAGKLRGRFYLSGGVSPTPITSPQAVTDNEWHHVVLTASTTTQSLYLDGARLGSIDGTVADQSRAYVYLGGGYANGGWMSLAAGTYHLDGQVDEAAFYRSTLTDAQVSAHYRAQVEAADSGLTSTVKVTGPLQHTSTISYDALRGQRIVAAKDTAGALTSYAYDTAGNLHTVTDPNGHATVTGHDARGNVVSSTTCRDTDSCWTSFSSYYLNASDPLDPRNDKPLTLSDQRSIDYKDTRYRTQYAYSTLGLPTTVTRPDSSVATTTYTAGTETAVGGGTVPAGLVLTQTTPGGARTSYRYYAGGDLAEVTSPSGLVTSYTYDGLGRKTAEKQVSDTFPSGVTTTYAYDAASHIVTETGAGIQNEITQVTHTAVTSRAYDEDGNLLSEATKDTTGGDLERAVTYHYDTHGLNDSATDAEQNTTQYEHDALGRAVGTTDPAGTHVTYTYTAGDQHATTVLDDWTGDPSGTTKDLTLVSNAYDPAGRLASTTDAMGATTAYTYYDDGLAATTTAKQVTQADGTRHDIVLESDTYDPAGNLTKQVTGAGTTTQTFTVDALGRTQTSVLDPSGLNRTATYTYDGDDRVKEQTQAISGTKKLTTTSEYDPAGNVTKQTVTDGTTTHITTGTYDDRGLPLTSVSPRGNVTGADPAAYTTTYRYDALGRPVQQTAPAVQSEENGAAATTVKPTTLTGYNTFGEATAVRDARGKVTRAEVDRLGRTTAVTLPDYTPPGASTALTASARTTYTALGQPQTATDPLGRVTRYAYDQFGQMIAQTDPAADAAAAVSAETDSDLLNPESADGGGVTRTTWTPTGLQLSVTDPMGARTEATYDELGRQLTATTVERHPTSANLVSRYTWDDAGNQTASTTPSGITTTSTYNAAGEPRTLTDPAGITKFDYDGLGRQTETTDATNRRTTTAYDALGDITADTDYGTGTTALRTATAEYDVEGNRTAAVPAGSKARSTYAYDALGRTTTQTEPVTATTSITTTLGYDAAGNLTRLTDGRGNKTVYTFNSLGLPESTIEPSTTAHPNAADRTWTTVYDKAGQAVTELLPGGMKRERTYDGLGRLTRETGTGAEATTATRTLGYDLTGHLTAIDTADGLTRNTYTYNDQGALLTAAGPGGTSRYAYNADGSMTQRTTTAGTTDYTYDAAGRIDTVRDSITGNNVLYDFDAAGRPSLEQYATSPTGTAPYTVTAKRTYGYDELGRLNTDAVTSADGTTSVASTTYGYDLDDNLTSKKTTGTAGAGTNTYTYDYANRMTSWTKDATATTSYEWDAAGNRTKAGATTATFDARNRQLTDGTTTYTYTARGTLSSTSTGSGSARALTFDAFERKITDGGATYAYDRVQTRNSTTFTYDGGSNNLASDGTTDYDRTPDGTLLSLSTGSTDQWALTDQHTDLVAGLTTDGNSVSGSTSYDPFGKETATSGSTPAVGYQSGWTDPASGDVNMAARWYQPGTGSFESRDTWQLDPEPSGEANRYGYINGGPLNGTDPTGHIRQRDIGSGASSTGTLGFRGSSRFTTRRSSSSRSRASSSGSTGRGTASRAQARRMQREMNLGSNRGPTRPVNGRPSNGPGRGKASGRPVNGRSTAPKRSTPTTKQGKGTTTPRTPRPPQNPNKGPRPKTAPKRSVPRAKTAATYTIDQGVSRTVTSQAIADMVGLTVFIPLGNVATNALLPDGAGTATRRRTSGDCRTDGAGWVEYGDVDSAHGGRATGVEACLDSAYLDEHPGTETDPDKVALPGYKWARKYAGYLGNRPPGQWVNACHLLGQNLSGDGLMLENLSTCARSANANRVSRDDPGVADHMYSYERQVKKAIDGGQIVHYQVEPVYMGPRTVPVAYEMSATGTLNGKPGLSLNQVVPNMMYSNKFNNWSNIGTVDYEGKPVPTGATP
ncbi:LamG-like jellyroll fold domain-containing protein [Streptomyces sp. NPDC017435]|uniref:LamG-like jellyroll fold domain-containing protein n=1 Tax=Streptomyces sp. NPDC017435 TaxID=3364995 RepID=UPI0037A94811